MAGGRPSKFNKRKFNEIIYLIAGGSTVKAACKQVGIPFQNLYYWLLDPRYKEFLDLYTHAMNIRLMHVEDEILDIADSSENDFMEKRLRNGEIIQVPDYEVVNRSKLRCEVRERLLNRMENKRKYIGTTESNTSSSAMQINIITSDDQKKLLDDLQKKRAAAEEENKQLESDGVSEFVEEDQEEQE